MRKRNIVSVPLSDITLAQLDMLVAASIGTRCDVVRALIEGASRRYCQPASPDPAGQLRELQVATAAVRQQAHEAQGARLLSELRAMEAEDALDGLDRQFGAAQGGKLPTGRPL